MKRTAIITIMAVSIAAGLGSFFATLAQVPAPYDTTTSPLARFLKLTPEQQTVIDKADLQFEQDLQHLGMQLENEKERLAALLEDTNSTDTALLAQVESVISTHNDMERRVATHLLRIRTYLTPEQQKELMGLAATGVRHSRHRWRGGEAEDQSTAPAGTGSEAGQGGYRYRGGRAAE